VLWLDDLQWADTETLDLLLYLARSLAEQPAPVLLLLTLRTGAESFTEMQSSWLMALKRTGMPLSALALAAFTQEETQHFVQALAWAEQPLEVGNNGPTGGCPEKREAAAFRDALLPLANWLYVQTQGQPLYLVETLNGLLKREIILPSLQEKGSWGFVLRTELLAQIPVSELIPSSVRELIRSHLGRLTPPAWALLVAGAAMGQGLTFERLIEVAQLDEREGLRALEELLRNGLLCERNLAEDAQAFEEYAFPREMIREVVYQEAGVTHLRLVQRRLSAVRQEEAADDPGEEAHPPRPALVDGHTPVGARHVQGQQVVAGAASRDMRGTRRAVAKDSSGVTWRHADVRRGEQTLPVLWERGAAGQAASAFPRSPPGSSARAFFETHRRGGKSR
jgi:hypothetical protein